MSALTAPAWCEWRQGHSPLLIVAPHGGRRDPSEHSAGVAASAGRGRKVNDLHTAGIATELATALDASLIVNPTCDRNQLDLNRISQVAARAPWFLALFERLLTAIFARHERAEVLFVHGWNVVQTRCDIGVGQALAALNEAAGVADALTVSPAYAIERLGALQHACVARGIAVSFGDRYPGQHPNNLLQLFRRSDARGPQPALAAWAVAGQIEAVQLELGAALRWPGPPRRAFVEALTTAFTSCAAYPAAAPVPAVEPMPPDSAASLQAYDPKTGVGLALRVDPVGPNGGGGRVLVFVGDKRVALYIGESPGGGVAVEGPAFAPCSDGFTVRFDGYALATDEGWRYVDLEDAFAFSDLSALRLALRFRRGLSADYGHAEGWVEVDGARHEVAAAAFARHGILQRTGGVWSSHVALLAALGPTRAVRVRHEFPGRSVLHDLSATGELAATVQSLTVHFDGDRRSPARIVVGRDALCCRPLTRMSVSRPLPAHRQALVTFGAAEFDASGVRGFGFYEYGRVVGC